jgi:hypothetical protein
MNKKEKTSKKNKSCNKSVTSPNDLAYKKENEKQSSHLHLKFAHLLNYSRPHLNPLLITHTQAGHIPKPSSTQNHVRTSQDHRDRQCWQKHL